jgi:uncharacterized membrane protein YgcG
MPDIKPSLCSVLPHPVLRYCASRFAHRDRAQTLPRPTSKVSDLAGVLTPAARADLESLLTTLEKKPELPLAPRVY